MKKFAVAVLCCGLLVFPVFAQSGKATRPRVVTSETPSAETNQDDSRTDTNRTNQTKRPPVLIGSGGKVQSSEQTSTADAASVEDENEVIRVETNLVTFPVSVLDRDGRFLSGLKQSDFQIFEDGAPQKIEYFASIEQPFTVVLLLDVSPSTAFKIEEIQDAAISFINQLRPEDRVIVMSFDERVRVLSRATNNRAALRDAIRQTNFGDGTSLYEAVHQAMSRELQNIEGRKAIVLFTDGVDTTSRMSNYQSNLREAEEADSLIYTIRYDTSQDMAASGGGGGNYPSGRNNGGGNVIGAILGGILSGGNVRIGSGGGGRRGGGGSSRADYEKGRQYLEDLSRTSGGRAFDARSLTNVDAAFSGIAEELRRQYSIGYYPEKSGDVGQRKQIKVRTNLQGAVVRAKSSYIVGKIENNPTAVRQPPRATSNRLPF
ncbi:MAG: VWA domain-containing protein [Pyrinomonadaceae bacterium]